MNSTDLECSIRFIYLQYLLKWLCFCATSKSTVFLGTTAYFVDFEYCNVESSLWTFSITVMSKIVLTAG